MNARLESVNFGRLEPNPYKEGLATGINKSPRSGRHEVVSPGLRSAGSGSGLVGDSIGDTRNHGGDRQALYAFEREDLDAWEGRLNRPLANGFFGENLTTAGLDVNGALLGERWRIGDQVEVMVTGPRIPCSTFRGWVGEKGWLKTFTAVARPGAYLQVVVSGTVEEGDLISVLDRPDHDVTISLTYRALTTERDLLPELRAANPFLDDELRGIIAKGETLRLG
ncbi:MAG: MOSC domain-containing protein [Rhodoglobus sp.]